jgi:hypothetical protein
MTVVRMLAVAALVAGGLLAASIPASAKDAYLFAAPLLLEVSGADGQSQAFVITDRDDVAAMRVLIHQVASSIPGARTQQPAWSDSPHFRFTITRLSGRPYNLPWYLQSSTDFAFYPSAAGAGYLLMRIGRDGARTVWLQADPQVVALMGRHTGGLSPAGSDLAPASGSGRSWVIALATLLMVVALGSTRFLQRRAQRRYPPG